MACSSPNLIVELPQSDRIKFLGSKQAESYSLHTPFIIRHTIPCLKCLDCRVGSKSIWACRIMLEASCWDQNCFITLTYSPESQDSDSLNHKHWQQFAKDFRRQFCQAEWCLISPQGRARALKGKRSYVTFKKIKFFMAGEYGDQKGRRHFHAIIFGHAFSDLVDTGRISPRGTPIYTSPSLESVWKKGIVQVGEVNFDSAAYVASYITKKADGSRQVDRYGDLRPEYGRASQGIGATWLKKYFDDVFVRGVVELSDRTLPAPRYFHKKLEQWFPERFAEFKAKRVVAGNFSNDRQIDSGDGPLARSIRKGRILRLKHKQRKDLE